MSVQPQSAARPASHRIPRPRGDRLPLKANVFEAMQSANTQLLPLFPYLGEGAIVPCGATFSGGPHDFGHFSHSNPLDEIVVAFGADGGNIQPGDVHVLAKTHGVRPDIKGPTDPSTFLVTCITQRDAADAPGYGREAITFRCRGCSEALLRFEFDALPPPPPGAAGAERYATFATITGTLAAAEAFNADEARRTCPKCGRVNAPFPLRGWTRYVAQSRTANAARRSLEAHAAASRRAATAEGDAASPGTRNEKG
jgi:hypothetical protein